MLGHKIFVRVRTFRWVPPVLPCNFCHPVRRRKEGSEEQIHQGQPNRSRIHITQQIYQRYTINTSRIHHKYIDDTQQIRQRNATNTETERLIFATLSLRRNCFPREDPLWPPTPHLSQTPAATYQWKK